MQDGIRDVVAKILHEENGIVFAYIFGSAVTGQFAARSDIDIAVMYDAEPADFRSQLALYHKLSKALKRDVDIVVLNSSRSLSLRRAIVKEGAILVDRDQNRRLAFEVEALHDYLDFKYSMELVNDR